MTLDDLATRTGETVETLRAYIQLGLLAEGGDYSVADLERLRLVQALRRRGIGPESIADVFARDRDLFDRYIAQLYPHGDHPAITFDDAVARTGIARDLALRVREAAGLGGDADLLSQQDVDSLKAIGVALDAGFPEAALLQLVRVYADALNRVGEAEGRLFHFYVHEPLRASGLAPDALSTATTQAVDQLLGLVDPAVTYFHRKGLERAMRDDVALHLAEDAGLLAPNDETGRLLAAVAFIDLARFTALTEAMGDATAADVLNRFSDLVRSSVNANNGRIVKQIGDAFMLVFTDPSSAVDCALDIRTRAMDEPQFLGTRQGIHWGPVLYREGDYYGATVNLSARIVAEAAADQVLVSRDVVDAVTSDEHLTFVHAGHRTVKHVAQPVEVFEARLADRDHRADADLVVDPVCGMKIDPHRAAASLRFADRELNFCSQDCLQRFVTDPDRYG